MKLEIERDIAFGAQSLSARKLWIEIALKKLVEALLKSLSARKLWIEISMKLLSFKVIAVAFCEEAVD